MKREKAGRPKANIDWSKVDGYLKAQCTATGIASILGVSVDTLYNRCKTDNNLDFSAYSQQKKDEGKELLRANQFKLAMQGNIPMNIWLGKQYLDQKDKTDIDHTSKGEKLTQTVIVASEQSKDLLNELDAAD